MRAPSLSSLIFAWMCHESHSLVFPENSESFETFSFVELLVGCGAVNGAGWAKWLAWIAFWIKAFSSSLDMVMLSDCGVFCPSDMSWSWRGLMASWKLREESSVGEEELSLGARYVVMVFDYLPRSFLRRNNGV
jgi:hypothetical protein